MDDGHLEKRRRAKALAGQRAPRFVTVGDVAERIVARLKKQAAASGGLEAAAHHAEGHGGTGKPRSVKP